MRVRARLTLLPILFAAGGLHLLNAQTVNVDKTSLTLTAQFGSTAVSTPINITSTTANTPFSIFVNSQAATPWLKMNNGQIAVSGNTNAAVSVVADPTGLTPGKYQGSLNVFTPSSSTATQVN